MEKLGEELKTLIDDMNSRQEYVQNPQDVLNLDNSIEGRKKLNGRKIYEAILLLYYFSSASCIVLAPGEILREPLNTPKPTVTGSGRACRTRMVPP
jgi:hypothetical protein